MLKTVDMALLGLLGLAFLGALVPGDPGEPSSFPKDKPLSLSDLRALALAAGFPDPLTAAAVAMAESRGKGSPPMARPWATNIVTQAQADAYNAAHPGGIKHGPERSFGLWQVNTIAHPNYDESSLLDPLYNAQAAFALSSGGINFHAWSTYNDGSYKQYLLNGGVA